MTNGAARLRLRPYTAHDEAAAREGNEVMKKEGSRLLFYLEEGMSWDRWLTLIDQHRRRLNLSVGVVPATQLAADVDGVIVGSTRVRFSLNKELERTGGHVGYGVLPAHRGRGYATEMLRQGLVIARSQGVERVLVTCLDDNLASKRVIEKCGGELEGVIEIDGPTGPQTLRRYWLT